MRVIGINAVYGIASTGRTVKQLNDGLKEFGIESSTVYFNGPGTDKDMHINTPSGVKLHGFMARLSGKAGYYSAAATKKLLDYLDEQRPDIVHLHNLHSNFIKLPMLFDYLSERQIPVAVTLHDCWWYTGKCTHYTLDGCYRWQSGCGSCPRLKKDIPSWLFDRTGELLADKQRWFSSVHPLAVIGVSDWITNEAKKSFLGDADIIERIYNWIDTDVFKPNGNVIKTRFGLENKTVLLTVASQWADSKGLAAFIELSHRLPEDTVLVMIGQCHQKEKRDLSKILLVPATENQTELANWYSAADVFISLSMEESFGKVTAEALACGTPVIAVNSTASPELIGENCGEVINDTKPQTVLDAVNRIVNTDKNSYLLHCRRFAERSFNMKKCIEQTAEVYRRLLRVRSGDIKQC